MICCTGFLDYKSRKKHLEFDAFSLPLLRKRTIIVPIQFWDAHCWCPTTVGRGFHHGGTRVPPRWDVGFTTVGHKFCALKKRESRAYSRLLGHIPEYFRNFAAR